MGGREGRRGYPRRQVGGRGRSQYEYSPVPRGPIIRHDWRFPATYELRSNSPSLHNHRTWSAERRSSTTPLTRRRATCHSRLSGCTRYSYACVSALLIGVGKCGGEGSDRGAVSCWSSTRYSYARECSVIRVGRKCRMRLGDVYVWGRMCGCVLPSPLSSPPPPAVDSGADFSIARTEGRAPELMDMWEGEVPWGQLALTALKVWGWRGGGQGNGTKGGAHGIGAALAERGGGCTQGERGRRYRAPAPIVYRVLVVSCCPVTPPLLKHTPYRHTSCTSRVGSTSCVTMRWC